MKSCCDFYADTECGQGNNCPVRLRNAQILAGLQREVTHQLAAAPPVCSALITGNGGAQVVRGTSTPAAPVAPEAPYQWLDDLFIKVLSRALLTLSAVIAIGCTGYIYRHFWGQ